MHRSASYRARLLAAWLVALYLAPMYVRMGWIKFDPLGFWSQAFARWGYPPWFRILIGTMEVLCGVCLIIPWTSTYGAIGLIMVMLGAWATRARDGRWVDVAWISLYIACLIWIGYQWRGFRLRHRSGEERGPASD